MDRFSYFSDMYKIYLPLSLVCLLFSCKQDNSISDKDEIPSSINPSWMDSIRVDTDNQISFVNKKDFIETYQLASKIKKAKWVIFLEHLFKNKSVHCFSIREYNLINDDTYSKGDSLKLVSCDLHLLSYHKLKDITYLHFSFYDQELDKFCSGSTVSFIDGDSILYRGGFGNYQGDLSGFKFQKNAEENQLDRIDGLGTSHTIYYYESHLQAHIDTSSFELNNWFKNEIIERGYKLN